MSALDDHLSWCRQRELADSTLRQRRARLAQLAGWCGLADPVEASRERVEGRWGSTTHLGRYTRRGYLVHARQFYRWALVMDVRADDPTVRIRAPKAKKYLPRPVPESALRRVIESAAGDVLVIIALAAFAGLRAREIALLRWEDVGRDEMELRITEQAGKGRRPRVAPLSPMLAAVLLAHGPAAGGLVYVLARRRWRPECPVSPAVVSQKARRHLDACGVSLPLHSCRHRFATAFYEAADHDLLLLAKVLGHASAAIAFT